MYKCWTTMLYTWNIEYSMSTILQFLKNVLREFLKGCLFCLSYLSLHLFLVYLPFKWRCSLGSFISILASLWLRISTQLAECHPCPHAGFICYLYIENIYKFHIITWGPIISQFRNSCKLLSKAIQWLLKQTLTFPLQNPNL